MWWLAIPVIVWAGTLAALVPEKGTYKSLVDRAVKGRLRDDRNALQIMLNHLENKPEEWSVSRTGADFPLEGPKQIMIERDEKHGWQYVISSSGERFRKLDGHFAARFATIIHRENDRRQSQALLGNFGIEGQLLLK